MGWQKPMTVAEFRQRHTKPRFEVPAKPKGVKKGRPAGSESQVVDSMKLTMGDGGRINDCTITIAGLIPGLNQLLREHFTVRKRRQTAMMIRLTKLHPPIFDGPVKIIMTGHCTNLSDWDNFCSKAKLIFDSLVEMGVLKEDNPSVITGFIPKQVKARRKDQCMVFFIESVC